MVHAYRGVDHVQLAAPAGCEPEARAFYHALLCMVEIEKPDALRKRGGVWFQCGMQQLHIGIDPNFSPATKAHPAFHVQNLAELKEKLLSHGIPVRDDELLPGAQRFYVADPFGNRLEFLEWNVDGRGA